MTSSPSFCYNIKACEGGETGRRARLRGVWATIRVQVPSFAPIKGKLGTYSVGFFFYRRRDLKPKRARALLKQSCGLFLASGREGFHALEVGGLRKQYAIPSFAPIKGKLGTYSVGFLFYRRRGLKPKRALSFFVKKQTENKFCRNQFLFSPNMRVCKTSFQCVSRPITYSLPRFMLHTSNMEYLKLYL